MLRRRVAHALLRPPLACSFNVLAIESSADDTCAAVVNSSARVLSNIVIKQHDIHETYGGINPIYAMESHQRNMPYAVQSAITEAGLDLVRDIDGIAFTRGPGMPGCLSVGMNAAKTLAASLHKPIVGVHHMQGHALTPLLTNQPHPPKFPFLSLLVSGGHTLLLLAESIASFKVLASTRDESIGRTYDKVSRLLDLKWTSRGPGHALEKFCEEESSPEAFQIPAFPPPLIGKLEFSFSGLHSQVQRIVEAHGGCSSLDLPTKRAIARAFQSSGVGQLEEKLQQGLLWCKNRGIVIELVILSGGVASNNYLRERLRTFLSKVDSVAPVSLISPPQNLCTGMGRVAALHFPYSRSIKDNAVMIGWASMHRFLSGNVDQYDIGLRPKWNIEDL